MKFVLFSDLHLDCQFGWLASKPEAARRRRQALRDVLLTITRLVHEHKADALLCGGDLYEHERVSPDTAQFLRSAFAELHPTPVYLAPGNHDWHGAESIYRQVDWTPNVHIFMTNRLEPVGLTEGLTLWGAAHCAPANTAGFLDDFKVDREGVNVALFHGSEWGWLAAQGEGKAPHAPFSAEQIERAGLQHVFLGHYHCPRNAPRYTYPGNPDPLTFGEDGERAAVIATVSDGGTVTVERCRVAVSAVHDIKLEVGGCASQQDIRERLVERLAGLGGVARVTLQGELASEIDLHPADLANAAPHMDGLTVRVGTMHVSYDLDAISNEMTVRGQFVRDVLADPSLSEVERRRVVITGLRALEGREDLEAI